MLQFFTVTNIVKYEKGDPFVDSTVFWIGGGILSAIECTYMGIMMLDRQKYRN